MQESLFNNDVGFNPQLSYENILTQESSLTIFKHPFLWNAPSTPYYATRQARQFLEARQAHLFMKHAKHVSAPSTPARHLADSKFNNFWFLIFDLT